MSRWMCARGGVHERYGEGSIVRTKLMIMGSAATAIIGGGDRDEVLAEGNGGKGDEKELQW